MQQTPIVQKTIHHDTVHKAFAHYNTAICQLMPFYPVHWHEEVELIRIVSGSGKISVSGVYIDVSAKDIVLIPPFALHTIDISASQDMVIDTVLFNLRLLDTSSNDMCNLRYFAPMLTGNGGKAVVVPANSAVNNSISMSLDTICLTVDDGHSYQLAVKANLYWVFYHLYHNDVLQDIDADASIPTEDKKLYTIQRILQLINSQYTTTISIAELSQECGYSQYYIMKIFKQLTNCTIVDYANNLRLNIAGIALLSSNNEVADIAKSVGYNNISYFNRQFLSRYGVTPLQYRNGYQLVS